MAHVTDAINAFEDAWDNRGITIHVTSTMYKLLSGLATEYDRVFDNIDDIRDSHHIATAEGEHLGKLGDLVNLDREEGESDARYRARLKIKFRGGITGTTFEDTIQFFAALLDTDVENITMPDLLAADPGTAYVRADASVFDNAPLTRSEITDLGGDVVPAGHEVKIEEEGTFILKQDGDPDDADKGLTSDAISTGGTLATDIN